MNENTTSFTSDDTVVKSSFETIDSENSQLIPDSKKKHGISWRLASLFITGEVLGGGAVAMADATVSSGLYGIMVILLGFLSNIFVSVKLSQAVVIATQSEKSTLRHRNPYTYTVTKALGGKSQIVVSILLNITSTSVTTVYLLISTELFSLVINDIFPDFESKYEFRIFLVVIAIALIPVMLLGTPKDFWGVALFATLTTVIAVVITTIVLWIDAPEDLINVPSRTISVYSFFYGFGTIFFAFSGVPFLPNIQMDVSEPRNFPKSVYLGFVIIILTYIPMVVTGYAALGDNASSNIVYNVFNLSLIKHEVEGYKMYKVLSYVTLILFAGHFTFAYNLIFNSTAQELEDYLKAPRGLSWKRCLVRLGLILLTFTLAQIIPNFNIIMSFAGGTLMAILSFHLPIIAYLKLCESVPFIEKCILGFIFTVASIGVLGSLYTSVVNVINIYK